MSEGPFQATSTRAKLWSMPRLFSTYTSYLPLSSGVARRIVSVVVVLPISKNTLGGKKGRKGLRSVYARPDRVGLTILLCSSPPKFPAPIPLPPVSGPRPPKLLLQALSLLQAPPPPHLSSSSMSSPSLVQPTSGAGSPMISAVSVTVVPLRALVLLGPF